MRKIHAGGETMFPLKWIVKLCLLCPIVKLSREGTIQFVPRKGRWMVCMLYLSWASCVVAICGVGHLG